MCVICTAAAAVDAAAAAAAAVAAAGMAVRVGHSLHRGHIVAPQDLRVDLHDGVRAGRCA